MLIPTLSTHSPSLSHLDHHQVVRCYRSDGSVLLDIRGLHPQVTREVIRSRYISSTQPDMTRVTVRPGPSTKSRRNIHLYCDCWESRINIVSHDYHHDLWLWSKRHRILYCQQSLVSDCKWVNHSFFLSHQLQVLPLLSLWPGLLLTNVSVSWTAPSTGPTLGGYEVFYQTAAGSNGSSITTTTEQLTLTGLVLEQTYSIFVSSIWTRGSSCAAQCSQQHRNNYIEWVNLACPTVYQLQLSYSTVSQCNTHSHNFLHHCVMGNSNIYSRQLCCLSWLFSIMWQCTYIIRQSSDR